MSNTELATINLSEHLDLPGVKFTKRALIFDGEMQERDVAALGAALVEHAAAMPFWLGDYYGQLAKLRIALAAKEAGKPIKPERAEQMEIETLGSYADMTNQSRDDVVNTQRTMAFFPHAARRDALSFDHHQEAFAHADGDLLKANGWLDLAEQKQWTVAQLRAFIRKDVARDGALDVEAHEQHEDIDVKAEEFALWAAKRVREVPKLGEDKCAAMLDALRPVADLIDRLRLACGKTTPGKGISL